jgi:amidase
MDAADLVFAGPARQAELVAAGEVSPRELVDACLQRIERLDPKLNAFRVVFAERARAEADALGQPDGLPLFGVPVAIKDDQDVAGEPTQFGSAVLRPPATADSEIVRRLRALGAIVIGKTNVPELTIWPWTETQAYGITRNPWDLERITGGSSGGSAAAVAAGLVGVATASDGLGSIRIPAACCGLVGLKPRKGRVPIAPKTVEEMWYGLGHYGVLTRRVRDTALVLDAIADRSGFAAAADRAPGKLRVGVALDVPSLAIARLDDEVRAAVEDVAATLRSLGHHVAERPGPRENGVLFRGVSRWFRGVLDDTRRLGGARRMEKATRGFALIGRITPRARLERSLAEEREAADRTGRIFDEVDVLMTPVTAVPPLRAGGHVGRGVLALYSQASSFAPWPGLWNIVGHPAMSIPAGWSAGGLPLAAQLVARDEETLLSLAAQLEAEREWPDRRPPIF